MEKNIWRKTAFWCVVIIALGIVLRSIQYAGGSSLWFDELSSARNIESRTFYELATQSLDYNQVAPVGFLLSQKLMLTAFGTADWVHRLLPWLASVAGIFLFWLIARRYLEGVNLVSSLIFFCGSTELFWLANNAKQYSGDIAVSLFLVWAGLALPERNIAGRKVWVIATLGGLGALSSFPGALLAVAVLAVTLWSRRGEWSRIQSPFLKIGSFWSAGAILNLLYARFVVDRQTSEAMEGWWAEGFPPSLNPLDILSWFFGMATDLIAQFILMVPLPVIWTVIKVIA